MRRFYPLLAVAVSACGLVSPSSATTPAPAPPPPISVPTTTTTPVSTTSTPIVGYEISDCDIPPVTFALLCDVYERLNEFHLDAPLDPASLAAGAAVGIESYRQPSPVEPVSNFTCAIPDPAFETTCEGLATHLRGGGVDFEEALEAGVASMIRLSLDPFTYYVPPELSGALTEEGVVSAVGLLLTITNDGGAICTEIAGDCRLEVVLATVDGPSLEAGLAAGDVVTAIDGVPVEGVGLVEIASRLDGEPGTEVVVTVTGPGGVSTDHTVVRSEPVGALEATLATPEVAYVRLPDFERDIPAFLRENLASAEAEGAENLVLDLRDNPGGFLDAATLVASEFLEDGLVTRTIGPAGDTEYLVQDGGLATEGLELTIVVNGGSASAAEIVAAVLQERGRATVVGAPTFGKDTVQIPFDLRNDGQLRVTVANWVTPEGFSVADGGVVPDVLIDFPVDATPLEVVDLAS